MVVEDFLTRDLVPGEGESLEYRLAKLGLHCHIFFLWEILCIVETADMTQEQPLLINIQLNLHIQHLAFQ